MTLVYIIYRLLFHQPDLGIFLVVCMLYSPSVLRLKACSWFYAFSAILQDTGWVVPCRLGQTTTSYGCYLTHLLLSALVGHSSPRLIYPDALACTITVIGF